MEVEVAQESMEEDNDEDAAARVSTPDLVIAFSDQEPVNLEVEYLVLNSSSKDYTEDNRETIMEENEQ